MYCIYTPTFLLVYYLFDQLLAVCPQYPPLAFVKVKAAQGQQRHKIDWHSIDLGDLYELLSRYIYANVGGPLHSSHLSLLSPALWRDSADVAAKQSLTFIILST